MDIRGLLTRWHLGSVKLSTGFLEAELTLAEPDRLAAWELYVELVTRIATQPLGPDEGDEQTALDSIFGLWGLLRASMKAHPGCATFARLAVPFFNQRVRPFTAVWHRRSIAGDLRSDAGRLAFRAELATLQRELRAFTGLLADVAGVEDITGELLGVG